LKYLYYIAKFFNLQESKGDTHEPKEGHEEGSKEHQNQHQGTIG
jgi:hypothetical protein